MKKILILLFWLFPLVVFADPTIINVTYTGDFVKGTSITITGTDFGTHADYNGNDGAYLCALWDDFETGTIRTSSGYWFTGFPITNISVINHPSGRERSGSTYVCLQPGGSDAGLTHQGSTADHTIYMSTWRWYDSFDGIGSTPVWGIEPYPTTQAIPFGSDMYTQWNHYEVIIHADAPEYLKVFKNGVWLNPTSYLVADGETFGADSWINSNSIFDSFNNTSQYWKMWRWMMGNSGSGWRPDFYITMGTSGRTETLNIYTDDCYVSYTQARIILSDAPTWSESVASHRELQLPTAWTTTEITATVNVGSFSAEDTAYLYVVKSDGTVNTNGYKVTIGGSSPSTPTITGVMTGSIR